MTSSPHSNASSMTTLPQNNPHPKHYRASTSVKEPFTLYPYPVYYIYILYLSPLYSLNSLNPLPPSRMGHYGQSQTPGQGQYTGRYPSMPSRYCQGKVVGAAKAESLQSAESMEGRPKRRRSSDTGVPRVSSDVFVVRGSEVGQCAEMPERRPNKAKRHCSDKLPTVLAFKAQKALLIKHCCPLTVRKWTHCHGVGGGTLEWLEE